MIKKTDLGGRTCYVVNGEEFASKLDAAKAYPFCQAKRVRRWPKTEVTKAMTIVGASSRERCQASRYQSAQAFWQLCQDSVLMLKLAGKAGVDIRLQRHIVLELIELSDIEKETRSEYLSAVRADQNLREAWEKFAIRSEISNANIGIDYAELGKRPVPHDVFAMFHGLLHSPVATLQCLQSLTKWSADDFAERVRKTIPWETFLRRR